MGKVLIGNSWVSLEIVESYVVLTDMTNTRAANMFTKRDILTALTAADQSAAMLERCTVKELCQLSPGLADKVVRCIRQRQAHFARAENAAF